MMSISHWGMFERQGELVETFDGEFAIISTSIDGSIPSKIQYVDLDAVKAAWEAKYGSGRPWWQKLNFGYLP